MERTKEEWLAMAFDETPRGRHKGGDQGGWTDEEDAAIRHAARLNRTVGYTRPGRLVMVAAAFGRSDGAVRERARYLGASSIQRRD